jgi:formylmethanofuran dehydrogenase subunit C
MSEAITLTQRGTIETLIEADGLTADRLAGLSNQEIAAHRVRIGKRSAQLGDFFTITGERSAQVRLEGSLGRFDGIGEGMTSGKLVVDGDVGSRLGAGMTGGAIEVHGSAASDAGAAMTGGVIRISGDAGDRLGAAGTAKGMSGGEIVIGGSAGAELGARMRRGLIVVGGNVGEGAAGSAIAGTLLALGNVGANAGRLNKRGSIVVIGHVDVPVTYQYACTFEPPYVRLLLTYLRRRYGLRVDEDAFAGRYRRYCGEAGDPGKGEILHWLPE